MSRESLPEMVDATDTNTGEQVRVPRAWVDSDLYPHLVLPKGQAVAVPARSASKADWVTYASTGAPADRRLTAENAEAMTRDQLADHYTAQEG